MCDQLKSNQQISQQPLPILPLIQIILCNFSTPDSHCMSQLDHADSASRKDLALKEPFLQLYPLK